MPEKISDGVLNYASIIDDKTREQAITAGSMPFIHPHIALMPDAHLGKGATVGSVIPTDRAIIPAAVGVDIGCGMNAVKTQWKASEVKDLRALRERIESVIPLSPGRYNESVLPTAERKIEELVIMAQDSDVDPDQYAENWRLQLGSLGGGNHFIEVSRDEEDGVWLFLHSGSRGVGNKIAQRYIKVAQKQMEKWFISLPDPDLAYLVEGTREFSMYIKHLRWAQMFARLNREEMMDRVADSIAEHMGEATQRHEDISCHHNYTAKERHFGREVWLSRKGAISAHKGILGLIPGSMGDKSYVVVGKGDRASMCSAPHGAGRVFSRSAAKKAFTQDDLRRRMEGIEYRDSAEFIDEIPDAYKDIDVVMSDASDLVEIRHTLSQLLNVKGQ